MKRQITVKTNVGDYKITVSDKYDNSVERNYGDEKPFNKEELSALWSSIKYYPKGGLGECLITADNKRGVKRDPTYSKFTTQRSNGDYRCPVLVLK